jgi:hypothetical protein
VAEAAPSSADGVSDTEDPDVGAARGS